MDESKSPLPSGMLMTLLIVTGLILFVWHLIIHPEPQLEDPGPLQAVQIEGIAPFVAVASRHDDDAAVRFTAVVHERDRRHFYRHLRRIAIERGWYLHRTGKEQRLVVPEADLHLLREMESDPIGWVRRNVDGNVAPTERPTAEAQLVNVVVSVRGRILSGGLRVAAIGLWVLSILPAMVFVGHLWPIQDSPDSKPTGG